MSKSGDDNKDPNAKKAKKMAAAVDGAKNARHRISRAFTVNKHGLPDGCPVVPLGLIGERRFYLDSEQQLVALEAGEHTRLRLAGLFGRKHDFVLTIPAWTRQTDDGRVTGWRPERVAEALFYATGTAGVWDPSKFERGPGAWLGDEGELILHSGDKISIHGTYDPWGLRIEKPPGVIGRYVYPADEPSAATAKTDDPAGIDSPAALLDLFESWNWRRPELDPILLVGWLAAAMIGGALHWRPVCWLTGGKGTGKSTLQKAIVHLLGNNILALADSTAAGIWQTLKRTTLPVAVDEMEATEDNKRAGDIVKLARIAASGGKMLRGSDKHTSHQFTLRNCFLFSSVLVPPLGGPDRSRIAFLEMEDINPLAPEPLIDEQRLGQIGGQIRRNLVLGWSRYQKTLEQFRATLNLHGASKRGADQFGTLLACADLALHGAAETAETTAAWTSTLQNHAFDDFGADESSDEDQCLTHLLGSAIDVHRNGQRTNVGEWINRALGRCRDWDDPRTAQKLLGTFGVRIETIAPTGPTGSATTWCCIAQNHSGLSQLFERTRWQTSRGVQGVWCQALRRLPGAERSNRSMYFGGAVARAVLLPVSIIPSPDDEEMKPIFDAQMR